MSNAIAHIAIFGAIGLGARLDVPAQTRTMLVVPLNAL